MVGSGHSWSPAIECSDTLLDLSAFSGLSLEQSAEGTRLKAGAGAKVREILAYLADRNLTLPSIGLIAEQTVAGAIATGTHGSGRNSLSHYVAALQVAAYDENGSPKLRLIDDGDELLAARCAIGCLGVVTAVWLECVPQYFVEERAQWAESLEEVLSWESESPLQQFYLIPETWRLLSQRRRVVDAAPRWAALYRAYWIVLIDLALHVAIKLAASVFRSRRMVRLLFRRLLPAFVFPRWTCVDRSDRQLTMKHEWFRHLELEFFVQRPELPDALDLVQSVLSSTSDPAVDLKPPVRAAVEASGQLQAWRQIRGTYQHHYPICVRRVRPDDTLLSMASGEGRSPDDWYAVSLITYRTPREPFYRVARLLAGVVHHRLGGRIHWGKWFPASGDDVADAYPALARFRACSVQADPGGVFRNDFVEQVLFSDER